jgi:hypothetical protein
VRSKLERVLLAWDAQNKVLVRAMEEVASQLPEDAAADWEQAAASITALRAQADQVFQHLSECVAARGTETIGQQA